MLIDPRTFRRIIQARELLASDAHDGFTARAIAEQVGLSPFHFIRQFAALYGTTPHRFRTRVRLDRARDLLSAGTPVTEVCMSVGFSSLGSFSALFTRWVGASPTQYRLTRQVPEKLVPVLVPGCLGLLAQLLAPPRNSREAPRP